MRLTESIRNSILKAVIEHAFQDRRAALNFQRIALGEALYAAIIGPHERKLKGLPKDWCVFYDTIDVRNARGGKHVFPLKKRRIFASSYANLLVPPNLDKEVEETARDAEQLKGDQRHRRDEIWAILAGPTTLAKLIETWPAVEPLIPESILANGRLPVSADVEKLNRELGLGAVQPTAN